MRYTKQQLNYWRDMSWAQTIGHARDWLAIHSASPETKAAISAFNNKQKPPYEELRKSLLKK
jgi:hypothetical protein